jgi:hypothetical protein
MLASRYLSNFLLFVLCYKNLKSCRNTGTTPIPDSPPPPYITDPSMAGKIIHNMTHKIEKKILPDFC